MHTLNVAQLVALLESERDKVMEEQYNNNNYITTKDGEDAIGLCEIDNVAKTINGGDGLVINIYGEECVDWIFNIGSDCEVYAEDDVTINAGDNCLIDVCQGCIISGRDFCEVSTFDSCTIVLGDNCNVEVCSDCTITVGDNCVLSMMNHEDFDTRNITVGINCTLIVEDSGDAGFMLPSNTTFKITCDAGKCRIV